MCMFWPAEQMLSLKQSNWNTLTVTICSKQINAAPAWREHSQGKLIKIGSCGFLSVSCDEANKSDILKTAQGISLCKYCVIHMIEKHERCCLCQKAFVYDLKTRKSSGNFLWPVKKCLIIIIFFIFYLFIFLSFFKKFTFSKPSESSCWGREVMWLDFPFFCISFVSLMSYSKLLFFLYCD